MAFVKLDVGILDSSLWLDRVCREVFITSLLMAEPFEVTASLPQYEVRALRVTGYEVVPGWYGLVNAASVGICRRALVELEEGTAALERLGAPDLASRTADFEGRRLIRVDGGFIVLNFMKYRERDETAAERMRRYRANKTVTRNVDAVTRNRYGVTRKSDVADADADADGEVRKEKIKSLDVASAPSDNKRGTRFPPDFVLTDALAAIAKARGLDHAETFASFRDYWISVPGNKGRKLDWDATWRNWCRNQVSRRPAKKVSEWE